MKPRRGSARVLAATAGLACLLMAGNAFGQGVVVQAGTENGQGVLRARGSECFVITPYHVVERAIGPVTIVGWQDTRATAELVRKLPGDLAILRLSDRANLRCDEWLPLINFTEMLSTQTNGNGHLIIQQTVGSLRRIPVVIQEVDAESIYIRSAGGQIEKTMSGASLFINGARVGLLTDVDSTGQNGIVYQLDDIVRLSSEFFYLNKPNDFLDKPNDFILLAACSGNQTQTMVEPAENTDTPNATVAVSVTRGDSDCSSRDERRCAELDAIRQLLFVGVPGTNRPRAMIRNEAAATAEYQRFFEDLLENGGHARYVVRAIGDVTSSWTVVINHQALRIALEQEGIIRKFGY